MFICDTGLADDIFRQDVLITNTSLIFSDVPAIPRLYQLPFLQDSMDTEVPRF